MDKTITIRPKIRKNGTCYKIDLYALAPFSCYLTRIEIKNYLERGYKLEVNLDTTYGKDINKSKKSISEADIYLRILRSFEDISGDKDIKFLTRIIRNGGLVAYMRKLEIK